MRLDEFHRHRKMLMDKLPLLVEDEKGWMNIPAGILTDLWSVIYGITNGISESEHKEIKKIVHYKELV